MIFHCEPFYLEGNIALQNAVDGFRYWTRRAIWKWLAFTLILLGVIFELPVITLAGTVELIICAITIHILLTPPEDYL